MRESFEFIIINKVKAKGGQLTEEDKLTLFCAKIVLDFSPTFMRN